MISVQKSFLLCRQKKNGIKKKKLQAVRKKNENAFSKKLQTFISEGGILPGYMGESSS